MLAPQISDRGWIADRFSKQTGTAMDGQDAFPRWIERLGAQMD
jgi:hypothetical protein